MVSVEQKVRNVKSLKKQKSVLLPFSLSLIFCESAFFLFYFFSSFSSSSSQVLLLANMVLIV
tara:strand:+ start:736 stop:921 length:186 start_codon:yes stop_codon:yes gene_type:complete